jgi:sulfur carrier protein
MNIQVNGQSMSFPEGSTIAVLMSHLKLNSQRVVVEHNRMILDKNDYSITQLAEGDELEIIQFVPGG